MKFLQLKQTCRNKMCFMHELSLSDFHSMILGMIILWMGCTLDN